MSKLEETPPTSAESQLPSLKYLPSLGSNAGFSNRKVAWGPNVKPTVVPATPQPVPTTGSGSKPVRSKTIQEAFTLDLQSQLSITKPEFSRIVQSVKHDHDVSVESTLSKTSRTFLISGLPANVSAGRRELVKKLTKPVTDVMQVPSRAKAAIIGSGGRNIREIQDSFDVKINVARENNPDAYDEDLGDHLADVSIHGDVDSVKLAKQKIAEIVREDTKNSSITIPVENPHLLPFVNVSTLQLDSVKAQVNDGDIVISGPLEEIKLAKAKLLSYLKQLESELTEEQVKIPVKFQFLIDKDEIKEKFNVVVSSTSSDNLVTFLGHRDDVREAIAHARSSSTAYAVDTLDISKAHSKNLQHAKNLVLYFEKYNVLQNIKNAHEDIKIVLPQPEQLPKVDSVCVYISGKSDKTEEIKSVRKELIALVNDITPFDTLSVDDLDYELFHKEIKHILLASEESTAFVQFGDYYEGDDTILLVARVSNEDFKPSLEEIKESLARVNSTLDPLRNKQNNLSLETVDLESAQQDSLLNEVTLQLILEDVNQDGNIIQIKLHTPSANQITLRGNEKAVKIAKKAVDSIVSSPTNKFKDTLDVPANAISRLIGSKGSHTQQLRQKFDVQIDVPSESSNGKTVEVTVTGVQYNVDRAKSFIQQEAKKWADIITKEMFVAQKYHRNLIGPQGAYRNRLQDKYNVRIFFPKNEDTVTIRGPSRGVTKAHEELKSLLDFEMENGHKITMEVPSEHVSRIIGKNGEMINDIRADFGVEMDFLQKTTDPEVQKTGQVQLEITGSRQAIKDAQAKVKAIITEASDFTKTTLDVDRKYHKTIVGAGGHTLKDIITRAGGDGLRNRMVDVPNANSEIQVIKVEGPKKFVDAVVKEINKIVEEGENSVSKELDIPQEKQGALIGPGGFVRRQLETDFHVNLHVPNKGESGKVVLSGLPANVEKAEKKIFSEIIRDNYDHELMVPASLHEFVAERGAFMQSLRFDYSVNIKHGNTGRKANKLVRKPLDIPVDKVRGESDEKFKITLEEVEKPEVDEASEKIAWRLIYEDFDLDDLLGEDVEENKKSDKKTDEAKKQESLAKAIDAIEKRISLANEATTVGYVWSSDPSKFNKIVGPGGSNIKKIRDATGVIINVPRKSDKVNDVVYIKGTKQAVEDAVQQVLKTLKWKRAMCVCICLFDM